MFGLCREIDLEGVRISEFLLAEAVYPIRRDARRGSGAKVIIPLLSKNQWFPTWKFDFWKLMAFLTPQTSVPCLLLNLQVANCTGFRAIVVSANSDLYRVLEIRLVTG